MFTGFASENTPAIQVWDCFVSQASSGSPRVISLSDDCAPIQFFRTGGTATDIYIYLPTAPIEGKQIKIINCRYGANGQKILVLASDSRGNGTNSIVAYIGAGQTIDFCYSKNCISFGSSAGTTATGWISLNQTFVGSPGASSVISGGTNNQAFGFNSFVGSGEANYSNGTYSAVVGGNSNTASGSNDAVVGGSSNTASGSSSVVLGGDNNLAAGTNSFVAGGVNNGATGSYSASVGGVNNGVFGDSTIVLGGRYGSTRSISGNFIASASVNPVASASGVQQTGLLVLGRQTTDATATRLTSNTGAASTTNQVILPNNSAYYVKGSIIATVTGGGNTKSWDFIATIKRGANAAATSIVGTVTLNVQAADAGASSWIVAITADTTNGGLAVTVTGQAATTIRWVAKLESTEVTY
jgi:hypothetical protein